MKTFGNKTPADCGDRDCWYGRKPSPHKEVNFQKVFYLSDDEIDEYNKAHALADANGFWAAAIED